MGVQGSGEGCYAWALVRPVSRRCLLPQLRARLAAVWLRYYATGAAIGRVGFWLDSPVGKPP
jgi:hypothetical protein